MITPLRLTILSSQSKVTDLSGKVQCLRKIAPPKPMFPVVLLTCVRTIPQISRGMCAVVKRKSAF